MGNTHCNTLSSTFDHIKKMRAHLLFFYETMHQTPLDYTMLSPQGVCVTDRFNLRAAGLISSSSYCLSDTKHKKTTNACPLLPSHHYLVYIQYIYSHISFTHIALRGTLLELRCNSSLVWGTGSWAYCSSGGFSSGNNLQK